MYALNIDKETGRIMSVTFPKHAPADAVTVETLPEGDITDYIYRKGKFVHDPLPKPEEPEEAVPKSPRNITAGEYIAVNGVLYKATANIPSGGYIITGQNAIETTIEEQLFELTQKGE